MRTVTIHWAEPETDEMFRLRCRVYEGCPATGPSFASGGEPAEAPEVEVISAHDEHGQDRPDVACIVASDFMDDIYDAAVAEAEELEAYEYEEAQERKADGRRDMDRVMFEILTTGRA